jgi:phospholipase C
MTEETQPPQGPAFTRRRLLGATAAAGGAAMAAMALPPNVQKALASPLPGKQPSLGDIEHVVLLMQENRSFDHYFGTMSGVAGFSDPDAIRLPTGRSVFYQPTDNNPDGYQLPFHLDTRTTSAQWIPTTGAYSWQGSHAAWDGGKMDSWLAGDQPLLLMGYFEEQDLAFHRALADAFTICDRYHCSMLAPTSPNRLLWETARSTPTGRQAARFSVTKTW